LSRVTLRAPSTLIVASGLFSHASMGTQTGT
jgi:hypothetical protein